MPRHHTAHNHSHGHPERDHGHAHDQGFAGFLRYASMLPRMWTSEVSTAVVQRISPQPGETVLEIGAGMGAAMVVAAQSGASVVAVDPTPYMRRIMRLRRVAMPKGRRVQIIEGAAEQLPAASSTVDAVWSVNTMHHWGDMERAIREIHRVLKPGGRVLLLDEDFENSAHPAHAEFTKRRAKHGHHFTEIDPVAVAQSLRGLGFASATGAVDAIAGRPAKVVQATKA